MLKILILVLLLGVIVSLFSGLVFLFKDSDKKDSKRTLHALGVRISLAAALIVTVWYGIYTGELRVNSPWHQSIRAADAQAELEAQAKQAADTQTP